MKNKPALGSVLIVDDEPNALKVLAAILHEEGYRVLSAKDVDAAIRIIGKEDVDAVITDLKMPNKDGIFLFRHVSEHHPTIPVIFLTAYGTVDSAVHAMTQGAFYYFIKPPDYVRLKSILSKAVEQRRLKTEVALLRNKLSEDVANRIIGNSPPMVRIIETIEAIRDTESSVLISGETGTGKEVLARALHYTGKRKDRPFIAVNCAAMPGDLIESELFGYEKGAFTGAASRRIGRFEEASEGTIFLDEIGELGLGLQAKLLRALQEKEIERLGSNRKIKVNFRLISSTNRDLRAEVKSGRFREDLFYRINVVEMTMPPLRERSEDIPLLVSEFVREICARENKRLTVSGEVMRMFQSHNWPGNVRELRNVIERAVILARGDQITPRELSNDFNEPVRTEPRPPESTGTLRDLELQTVQKILDECGGNKSKAAALLGISRKALYKRIREMSRQ